MSYLGRTRARPRDRARMALVFVQSPHIKTGKTMNKKLHEILESIAPFVIIGIAIAASIGLLFLFIHAIFWGVVIGCVLWAFFAIKQRFFPGKQSKESTGRIIDHDKH
jgi:hypothetical protein